MMRALSPYPSAKFFTALYEYDKQIDRIIEKALTDNRPLSVRKNIYTSIRKLDAIS